MVNRHTITTALVMEPIRIHGLNFPILKCVFSMIMPIRRSLIASHTIHTIIAPLITANCALVRFMVYCTYRIRYMLTSAYAASLPVAPIQ